jgi:nitrogen regulatory protein P-II 1
MKLVVATIRPERLACVQLALKNVKLESMNVTETYPCKPEDGHVLVHGCSGFRIRSKPKLRLEIIVNEQDGEEVVDAILDSGDEGRIFVVSLDVYLDVSEKEHATEPALAR